MLLHCWLTESRPPAAACRTDIPLCSTPVTLAVHFIDKTSVVIRAADQGWSLSAAEYDAAIRSDTLDSRLAAMPATTLAIPREAGYPVQVGDLRLLNEIGRGGFGTVFSAWDRLTREVVAVKFLRSVDPRSLQSFKNEFRRLADVHHPGLVTPEALLHVDGQFVLVMPYITGRDLRSALREAAGVAGPLLDEPCVRRIVLGLLSAIEALHDAGLVHIDLKPSNVLVDADGGAHVCDFGLSRLRSLRRPEAVAGTPLYMAPEQLRGDPPASAMDLYAIGVMLHEALSGGPTPFDEFAEERILGRLYARPTRLAVHRPGVDRAWAELCDALLARDPGARPDLSALFHRLADGRSRVAPRRRFLGRDAESAALERCWAEVRDGPAALAVVSGASGMGKTELVRRFSEGVRGADALVLWSRCHQHDQSPLKALDAAVEQLCEWPPTDEAALARLRRAPGFAALTTLFPALEPLAGPISEASPTGLDIARAGDLLAHLLATLAADRPVLLVLDDVQWGDVDSVDILIAWLSSLATSRVLAVLTHQGDEWSTSAFGRTLAARVARGVPFDVRRVHVDPLPPATAATFVADGVGRATDDPIVQRIVELASGLPFLLDRYVRARDRHAAPPAPERFVHEQLAGWPAPVRRFVAAAALAGAPTPLSVLAHAAAVEIPARMILADLRTADLLVASHVTPRTAHVPHDLVRTALHADLAPAERTALHRSLAAALAALVPSDPGAVALHLHRAGDRREAVAWAVQGAERAEHAGTFARAADLLGLARECAGDEHPDRRELAIRQADALKAAGLGERAADIYLACAATDASPSAHELRRRAADACMLAGSHRRGLQILAPVLRDQRLAPPAAGFRGVVRLLAALVPAILRRDAARPSERPDPLAAERSDTCWIAGKSLILVEPLAGLDMHFRSLHHAARSGSRQRLGRELGFLAASLLAQLPPTRAVADRWLATLADWAREDSILAAQIPLWTSLRAHALGDLSQAVAHGRQALAALADLPWATWERVQAASSVARALRIQGEYTACTELSRAYLVDAERRGDLYAQVLFGDYQSLPAIARGNVAEARARIAWAAACWFPDRVTLQSFYWTLHRSYADLYEGDLASAIDRVLAGRPAFRRVGGPNIVFLRVDHDLLEARLALAARGRPPAGLRSVRQLIARLARERPAEARGNAHLLGASLLARDGRRDEAVAALDQAVATLEPAGITMEAHAARYWRARLQHDDSAATAARTHMRRLGARDPEGWAALVAPAFID